MIYTDLKQLIHPNNDADQLEKGVAIITKRARELSGNTEIKFDFKDSPYPHFINKSNLSWQELREAAGAEVDIHFRGIGEDVVALPGVKTMDVEHVYTPEEKEEVADRLTKNLAKRDKKEIRLANKNKKAKLEIKEIEGRINADGSRYREGAEYRTERGLWQYDFKAKQKMFIREEDGELLQTSPLDPEDYQIQMNFNDNAWTGHENLDDKAQEDIETDAAIEEPESSKEAETPDDSEETSE